MLNRRHLRVKVLQSLYAYHQSHNQDIASGEKELLFGIEKIYDLYLYQLTLLGELIAQEERIIEENRFKRLPTKEDLNPNSRFVDNACLKMIAGDETLQKRANAKGISWNNDQDLVRKLLAKVKSQNYYAEYMTSSSGEPEEDTRFVIRLFKKDVLPFELLHSFYEEKSIYWIDDWELVSKMLIKTLKQSDMNNGKLALMDLFKEESDRVFAIELFRKAIINHSTFNEVISSKARNWDVERIALMDMIIMEMALTEVLKFPDIPVKVSLNEYIELSKMYSTPKSKVFVNGVLDKLVEQLNREGKIPGQYGKLRGNASE
ncbi:MAG: transcription antitermination factor NusB [Bacteroidales bacterium]